MDLVALAGKVSHVNRIASVKGADGEAIRTEYVTSLRIDGRHAQISDECSWLSDGDYVAMVAVQSMDGLVPLAMRNDTTGYENFEEAEGSYGFAILMIVLGVLLLGLIIGIFMLAWGLWLVYRIRRDRKVMAEAKRRLDSIPRASATAAA